MAAPPTVPDAFASAEDFLAALQRDSGGLITFIDTQERVRFASERFARWLGLPQERILGRRVEELYAADDYAVIGPWLRRALAGESVQYEREARYRGGASHWVSVELRPHFDAGGAVAGIFSCTLEVNELKRTHDELKKAAVLDSLTGLPNRKSLASRLEHAIMRVNRSGDRVALLFIDLDRFKQVNDTHGHAAGDEILRQAGARIRACVREVDTVARLGGDEFVVLLECDVRPDTPGIIGERVRGAFTPPFDWKGLEVRCGASVGVSLYPDHARDAEALLASADAAMYRVKHAV